MMMLAAQSLPSVLDSAGPQSIQIQRLWWILAGTSAAVFVAVIVFILIALVRGRRRAPDDGSAGSDAGLTVGVSVAAGATAAILFMLLIASVNTGAAVASLRASSAVTISVIGHQWWWEVQYEDAVPARRVETANEIHVPSGRPIVLKVTSRDVIHSFWAPNLLGKRDLIPGYTTAVWFQVDREGRFRGQCAEFCGLQHAHMAFDVVAEREDSFEAWLNGQRDLAREPQTGDERRGQQIFMDARCSGCHRIRGTGAGGLQGPDLTHVASRGMLGAGTLPNAGDHLAAWISNPQATKPGNQMPPNPMAADELQALVAYLGSLH